MSLSKVSLTPDGFPVFGKFTIGYVKDGVFYDNVDANAVEVGSHDDCSTLTGHVNPGTIAFTAGCKNAWQLDVDGSTWKVLFTEQEE